MRPSRLSTTSLLILLALVRLIGHTLINHRYGFHRDELAMLDDARHLAWGFVAYPPLTAFFGRVSLNLFGASLTGLRFFAALFQCTAMVVAGLIAKELGGGRRAQVLTALATAIAPMSLIMASLYQYISFDFLWWVLAAYCLARRVQTGDPRWWFGVGAALGLGMLTKYTIVYLIAGVIAGVLATPLRGDLRRRELWLGAGLSVLIFLPNALWQIRHDFISLEFLTSIHARDVAIGRADDFLLNQFLVNANPFLAPLWVAGLVWLAAPRGEARYRLLGWLYLVPLALFALSQGRFYYLAPAYPMLLAAGSTAWEKWLAARTERAARRGWVSTGIALGLGALIGGAITLPLPPINSPVWEAAGEVHDNFREQIGWEDLVASVGRIYQSIPQPERSSTGIFAGNYGEAGAVNLYGAAYGLPEALSGMNSFWLRGYPEPPPQTLIVLGYSAEEITPLFAECVWAGRVSNEYGVENEETLYHPDIFVCRGLLLRWQDFWAAVRSFG
jgi:4-amino-4-deoxy-L-arabinose transferase-like glycosyltransferase